MLTFLYVLGLLTVSACGGPEDVEAAYPLTEVTELTPLDHTSLTGALTADDEDDEAERLEDEEDEDEEEPYFDASMSPTYTAYLGKTATLTCIVHAAKSDKSVSWIRGRDLRILTVGRYTYTTDLRFEALHQQASTEWTLRVKSVQLRDQGNYECQITTKPIRTFNVFLKVVEPTVEVLGAPDIYVNRASMINLTCIVHHAPYPPEAITWFHNNHTISYTSPRGGVSVVEERGETTTSFLLLQQARATDSGTFTCQPEGMEPALATLHVLDGEHQAAMQTNSSCVCAPRLSAFLVVAFIVTCCAVL
ncbi:zwei Ig domain protein zig-8 [Procambarus clarkii]|uniref:zwei Ig domain protein zig-8 n=1 Tax=Procambarus clarkii TaxID=6728 RepID=UPI001E6735CB|nr:zwei Ig domain protein zig-8-like [Procambarus clarkii]